MSLDKEKKHLHNRTESLYWINANKTVKRHILGIDKNDKHKKEDEEGVSLLEVDVPQGLSDLRNTVAREETAQL